MPGYSASINRITVVVMSGINYALNITLYSGPTPSGTALGSAAAMYPAGLSNASVVFNAPIQVSAAQNYSFTISCGDECELELIEGPSYPSGSRGHINADMSVTWFSDPIAFTTYMNGWHLRTHNPSTHSRRVPAVRK